MPKAQPDHIKILRKLLDDTHAKYSILENCSELISPEDGVQAGCGVPLYA